MERYRRESSLVYLQRCQLWITYLSECECDWRTRIRVNDRKAPSEISWEFIKKRYTNSLLRLSFFLSLAIDAKQPQRSIPPSTLGYAGGNSSLRSICTHALYQELLKRINPFCGLWEMTNGKLRYSCTCVKDFLVNLVEGKSCECKTTMITESSVTFFENFILL